jgi:hypothetical protein
MSEQLYQKLENSESLVDVLIQMEDFLDSLDLYVFKNWIDGEVVVGPEIRRHWVSMTLKYEYEAMPDPAGAERLIQHGAKVEFKKETENRPVEVESPEDLDQHKKPKIKQEKIWLIEIKIPRRFIEELDDSDIEALDSGSVDVEDVSDARDEDIDEKDSFVDNDGDGEADAPEETA